LTCTILGFRDSNIKKKEYTHIFCSVRAIDTYTQQKTLLLLRLSSSYQQKTIKGKKKVTVTLVIRREAKVWGSSSGLMMINSVLDYHS
jgi:hypothetical protein